MKKIILTFAVAAFSLVAFAQAPPPPPPPGVNPGGPGTSGPTGKRVAADAPIGGELIILSLLAGGYALSRKRRLLSVDKEQQNVG